MTYEEVAEQIYDDLQHNFGIIINDIQEIHL